MTYDYDCQQAILRGNSKRKVRLYDNVMSKKIAYIFIRIVSYI